MKLTRTVIGLLWLATSLSSNAPTVAQESVPVEQTNLRLVAPLKGSFEQSLNTAEAESELTAETFNEPAFPSNSCTDYTGDYDDENGVPLRNSRRPFGNGPCSSVYFNVGALYLNRVPRFGQQPLVVDPNANTTLLATSNLNRNINPGLQATLGKQLSNGRAIELSYLGLFSGGTTVSAVKPNPAAFLILPGNLAGNAFVDLDRADVQYSSALNSFAINLASCCGCCDEECCGAGRCQSWGWFGGFNYLNLSERLNIATQRTVANVVETGTYNIRTTNNLYGMQLGTRFRRTSGRFGWDANGSAGLYGNDASQTQSVTDFPNFPLRPNVGSSRGGVAFVGGGNLSGLYALTNIWNLRAGYNVLWIEGLALAPDQLDFNFAAAGGGSRLNSRGGLFLHGVNLGLEGHW